MTYKNIIKIDRRKGEYLIFSKEGMLLSLDKNEFRIFQEFGDKKNIDFDNKFFLSKLVSYGILEFENYKINRDIDQQKEREYDLSLYYHNLEKPIYPAPILAHLAITNKCNMNCLYCSVRKLHSFNKKELSTEEWKKIIKKLADFGVFQIGFTGGEPTLRKDLPELVKFTHELGCVCNLTTNGWFLDEKLVEKLIKAGLKQCQVSLDSHIEKIHDKLRGEGSFKRAVSAIELLKKKEVVVGIDCVISKNNIGSILDMVKWIKEKQIPYLTLIKLKKGDLTKKDYEKLALDYIKYSDLIKEICKRESNKDPNITLDCSSVSNLQNIAKKEELLKIPIAGCPIGHHLICSSPEGDIYPCAALLDKKFYFFMERKLVEVAFEITDNCNYNCIHCYNPRKRDNLDFKSIDNVLYQLKEEGVEKIKYGGGEPTLRKNFLDILKKTIKLGFDTTFSTNGGIIDKELVLKIKDSGLSRIQISLDGDREVHNYIRQNNSAYENAINAIDLFAKMDFKISVATTLIKPNLDSLDSIYKDCFNLGVNRWRVMKYIPVFRKDLTPSVLEYKNSNEKLEKLKEKSKNLEVFVTREFDRICENPDRFDFLCFGARSVMSIKSNGEVSPCSYLPDLVVGNLKDKSLSELWNSKEMLEFANESYGDKSCNHYSLCHGGCKASSFYITGKKECDPYCYIKKN
jgi:AdoMet-dependent heme synthase